MAVPGLAGVVLGVLALSQADNTFSTYAAIALLASGVAAVSSAANAISQDAVAPMLRGMGAAVLYTSFDLSVGLNAQGLATLIDGDDFGTLRGSHGSHRQPGSSRTHPLDAAGCLRTASADSEIVAGTD